MEKVDQYILKIAERIRLDRESEASHDLNRLLDKPVGSVVIKRARKYLLEGCLD
jgi:hypothetical protein